ncbi:MULTISPECIES: hypothetical protein [Diaphorobacter]|uniref:Uncharacterized protein n=1 Tax=Acidovorax ebreus (strain TPSY) TaxID=535289 RepID=A0A9J9QCQ5_ACIET|nr:MULTISPECIES: hypothetical protein [Diaphorobacter]ACM33603.1 hypothetical protein Dtpsy_2154 [[Acidovorax] ebreus TPSY]
MVRGLGICGSLEEEVLQLYKRAVAERRWEIAEPLMCALEQLAQANPDCETALESAYLCVDSTRTLRVTPASRQELDPPEFIACRSVLTRASKAT